MNATQEGSRRVVPRGWIVKNLYKGQTLVLQTRQRRNDSSQSLHVVVHVCVRLARDVACPFDEPLCASLRDTEMVASV